MGFLKRRDSEPEYCVVAYAQGLTEAEIIGGLLSTAKIPYFIKQESIGRIFGFTVGSMGMIEIIVPIQYEDEAVALLDEPNLDDYSIVN